MLELELDDLYHLAMGGDTQAEKALFVSLNARFRLLARRRLWGQPDWEDVVQDALAVVYQKFGELDSGINFTAWAYQVLRYCVMNHNQRLGRQIARTTKLDEAGQLPAPSGFDPAVKRRLKECAQKIWRVNNRYARILNLHYQGYTTEEICERLSLQRSNYYSVLSRARTMLARCLETGEIT